MLVPGPTGSFVLLFKNHFAIILPMMPLMVRIILKVSQIRWYFGAWSHHKRAIEWVTDDGGWLLQCQASSLSFSLSVSASPPATTIYLSLCPPISSSSLANGFHPSCYVSLLSCPLIYILFYWPKDLWVFIHKLLTVLQCNCHTLFCVTPCKLKEGGTHKIKEPYLNHPRFSLDFRSL